MVETEDKLWHLEHFNVVKALSMKEKMALKDLATMKSYKKGETIYLPSRPSGYVYFLKKGNVRISRFVESGEEQVVDVIGHGELFGRYIFTEKDDNDEVAVALKDTLVCYLDVRTWNDFISENTKFTLKVLKLIGLRLKRLETRVEQLQFLNITDRIKTVLKELTDKHGRETGEELEKELKLNLTHQDIARLAGTSRQSVTTTLSDLQRKEVISYDRARIIIKNYSLLDTLN